MVKDNVSALQVRQHDNDREISGEQKMWCYVLLNAIADASTRNVTKQAELNKDAAIRYLTKPSKELATVCSLAGVEMVALVKSARKRFGEP